ncbi:hypothetical protein DH2020_013648 [Rehmannia glutinosa]|uniref:histone deacetylase n=1 Tax=Rehmannia glutinosa TaxID=99300 RepID=A0ABR0X670_REHGL
MNHFKDRETESRLQNGESAPSSNVDVQSEAANVSASKSIFKQHLVEEQKNAKRKSDMTLEEMYNNQYDFEDDEDDDSDWEPSALPDPNVVEIPKWFCINCTMVNIGVDFHCDVCGEHRESGILQSGFLASPFHRADVLTENDTHAAVGLQDSRLQSIASDNLTAIGFDERMLLHEEVVRKSHPHPERPDRLRAIAASLAAAGIFPGRCYPISAREITREELLMVHSSENIEAVELTSHVFSSYFTPDTYANEYSASSARLAAGLCFDLAAAIYSGSAKNGFALVRPPGHHAGVKQAMGFCLHNNAAIAASAAQIAGAKKVLIIDWDVHHGNGTQEIFEKNKSVLYISLHRHEGGKFYPGTGSAYEDMHSEFEQHIGKDSEKETLRKHNSHPGSNLLSFSALCCGFLTRPCLSGSSRCNCLNSRMKARSLRKPRGGTSPSSTGRGPTNEAKDKERALTEVGTMGAEGYCVNVPWSRGGVGDNDYVFAFQQVVLPIVALGAVNFMSGGRFLDGASYQSPRHCIRCGKGISSLEIRNVMNLLWEEHFYLLCFDLFLFASEFDPDFTIISAGFDAARGDPLGCCDVTPTGYAQMTQMCSSLSGGKLLVILEGGYNLRSISSSATAVIKNLFVLSSSELAFHISSICCLVLGPVNAYC